MEAGPPPVPESDPGRPPDRPGSRGPGGGRSRRGAAVVAAAALVLLAGLPATAAPDEASLEERNLRFLASQLDAVAPPDETLADAEPLLRAAAAEGARRGIDFSERVVPEPRGREAGAPPDPAAKHGPEERAGLDVDAGETWSYSEPGSHSSYTEADICTHVAPPAGDYYRAWAGATEPVVTVGAGYHMTWTEGATAGGPVDVGLGVFGYHESGVHRGTGCSFYGSSADTAYFDGIFTHPVE